MLSLKLAPGSNPPCAAPVPCIPCVCVCVCVCIPYTVCSEGLRVGVEQEAQMGPGGGETGSGRKKKGACRKGNNRWTCSGGYGVSLITHRPHLLIYSNYLPTQWAPCQRRGVNTTDQIHLKVPTHSATPTPAFYGGPAALKAQCGRDGLHVNSFM